MVLSLIPDSGKSGMGMGMPPWTPHPRQIGDRGWGWAPDPRQIGDGTPIPIPGQIGDGDGDGDRGFRALTRSKSESETNGSRADQEIPGPANRDPDSRFPAQSGNGGFPDSRFGRNRDSGERELGISGSDPGEWRSKSNNTT